MNLGWGPECMLVTFYKLLSVFFFWFLDHETRRRPPCDANSLWQRLSYLMIIFPFIFSILSLGFSSHFLVASRALAYAKRLVFYVAYIAAPPSGDRFAYFSLIEVAVAGTFPSDLQSSDPPLAGSPRPGIRLTSAVWAAVRERLPAGLCEAATTCHRTQWGHQWICKKIRTKNRIRISQC